ncbi:uncharacterized protein UDID_19002 [Ustilago sp. UG-2017a]|nr:uncharacterized protein UDID_19002 [Ustilago sp. UG-2017a]
MVLLSALVLLLLLALLCHAAPMDPGAASSSSGARPPNPPGIQDLDYYYQYFGHDPNLRTLTNEELETHLNTLIHYEGTPLLFTDADDETKVKHTLKHYGNAWLVDPPTLEKHPRFQYRHIQNVMENNDEVLQHRASGTRGIQEYAEAALKFKSKHGDNALYLRYGRPFAQREDPEILGLGMPKIIKKLPFGRYKVPDLGKKKGNIYDLEKTGILHLRNTLDQHNYLRGYDSKNRLLGFALDKDGTVLFEELGQYHPRV